MPHSHLELPIKGSLYTVSDLVPDENEAKAFKDGLCLVFRLEASDYHHFCFIDNGSVLKKGFIPGELHSVQPIALRQFPVFRLNRRWWTVLDTKDFGKVAQIEIGAMAVGGVSFKEGKDTFKRGDEMGNFELAGSTIVLLLTAEVKKNLTLCHNIEKAYAGDDEEKSEVSVSIGSLLGYLKNGQ